jgi:hypothetical protein
MADLIALVADAINHFGDAVAGEPIQLIPGEGPASDGQKSFRNHVGERPHARAQAAGENHALHR